MAKISKCKNCGKQLINNEKCKCDMYLYKMELHEIIEMKINIYILRVPGGWLYVTNEHPVFVPFNDEFKEDEKSITAQEILGVLNENV